MDFRSMILRGLYKAFPFSLQGDAELKDIETSSEISCIINFYGRIQLLEGILYSLSAQDFAADRLEVVLVEDRGGTEEGRQVVEKFRHLLNIRYFPLPENYGRMGFSRNFGLSKAKGKYILFLDDDTVILKIDFISTLVEEFASSGAEAVVPHGGASFCGLKGKYSFHDPYFPTSRCMAYTRSVLREFGGFVSDIVGQEDVEFVTRFLAAGKNFYFSERLEYLHPPLLVGNIRKPAAVGLSFAGLRKRYPLIMWLLLLFNGSRYLPLLLFPFNIRWRMQGKFSLGFLIGVIYAATGIRAGYDEA